MSISSRLFMWKKFKYVPLVGVLILDQRIVAYKVQKINGVAILHSIDNKWPDFLFCGFSIYCGCQFLRIADGLLLIYGLGARSFMGQIAKRKVHIMQKPVSIEGCREMEAPNYPLDCRVIIFLTFFSEFFRYSMPCRYFLRLTNNGCPALSM